MMQPLHVGKLFEQAALEAHEFARRAIFDDLSVLEHEDAIRLPQGGEAVGDCECRATLDEPVQRLLDFRFRLRIDGAGRLVEDEDLRVV